MSALLHTWSLSVEEQFYLLFGLILFLGNYLRFGVLLAVLFGIGVLFAAVGYITMVSPSLPLMPFGSTDKANDAIFFLLPYRIILFAAGAVCGWAMWHDLKPRWKIFPLLTITSTAGALFSVSAFSSLEAWSAAIILIPYTGLLFPNSATDRVGEIRFVRWIARISFQIYLVHWPLIVFWRYWTFRELGVFDMFAIGILSIWGGWALERFVTKTPFASKQVRQFVTTLGVAVFACVSMQTFVLATDGAPFRIPPDRQSLSSIQMREAESAYCGDTHILGDVELGSTPDSPLITCSRIAGEEHIYIWGDSHARHLLPGIAEAFPAVTIDILYFTSCLPQSGIGEYVYNYEGRQALAETCVKRNREALVMFEKMSPTTIILHQYVGYEDDDGATFLDASRKLVDLLEGFGHTVTWVGGVPYPDRLLADCVTVPAIYSDEMLRRRCTGNKTAFNKIVELNSVRAALFQDVYIDIIPQFCLGESSTSCSWVKNSRPLFRDKHHLTVDTSIAIIRAIKNRIKVASDI
ncbi:acyltransferase family protein [Ahrensia marina]|uniref:SGNH domain-containing protein n=1 Tax=Ahrensia marina TaxID=1514904 RepID=A0A0N0E7Q7_9HYPH|nr:acyltransferase family protein [Ahrensia marina]KPB01452.1 hypothetical protein SU32_07610 [Ahrensia marina]